MATFRGPFSCRSILLFSVFYATNTLRTLAGWAERKASALFAGIG